MKKVLGETITPNTLLRTLYKVRTPTNTVRRPLAQSMRSRHTTLKRRGGPESARHELQEFLFRSYNKKKQTEDMILAICRGRWLTLPVLSQLLERHPVALRTRYLQPMIGAGKLRRKHESPNHRDQAYMTVE